ncbi:unnamed protein product [Prunus armeniaca]|uniref:Uncharacterized protein n=1 Tax=Prunus armeniaca TaxID=36596 RepID=A0A6J5U923_PRUAR|nr:unnamed protein product [Prunus armeniaca]
MAEWYMISWNAEVSRVFFRRCFAFSSVKHPSANLDPGRAGSLSEIGSLLREFSARSAVMYSAGSDDQPKSGVHQLEEEGLRRFGSGRWDPEALGRIETGLKDVRGVAMAMVDHRFTMQCMQKEEDREGF